MVVTRRQSGKGGSTEGFGSEIGTRGNHKIMFKYEKRVLKKKSPHSSSPDQLLNLKHLLVESVDLLTSVLGKYGDIGDNCSIGSPTIRSFYMQNICDIVEKLKNSNCISLITKSEAEKLLVFLKDAENVCFNVGWLKRRINEIYEGKQAFAMLKAPSELKHYHAEQKAKIHSAKQKTEIYKKEIAIHQQQIDMHQQQIHDLQEKIHTVNAEVAVYEEEALNSEKAIAECKAKLRLLVGLKSLDQGLL
ncbi:uncharacterized protein LOC110722513 [Chenopodium quinoa]|uniref:uncharacterized protein LOC110722513 n=1 Tax=Chenopodium quinoa TaxID=63459 RepID=UPI000B774126|nr:uncharacterized protein LOC110722513 [Chenopodium quinoa]